MIQVQFRNPDYTFSLVIDGVEEKPTATYLSERHYSDFYGSIFVCHTTEY